MEFQDNGYILHEKFYDRNINSSPLATCN